MGGRRSVLWLPATGEYWPAATAGYSRVRRTGRAPGWASGGRSRLRHRRSVAAVRPQPARVPVVAVRDAGRAARGEGGPPRPARGGRPRAGTPFDPAVPRSGSGPEPVAVVRAESLEHPRRCSQQHHAPSSPLKDRRGLRPPEPVEVGAQAPGRQASERSPGSAAAPVTTMPPPPGPLARARRADADRAWTESARRAGRRPRSPRSGQCAPSAGR